MFHEMKNHEMVKLLTTFFITANTVLAFEYDFPSGVCTPISGQMCEIHDNIVAFVPSVSSLAECQTICHDELACAYLTYFGVNSSSFYNTCVLFSSCNTLDECQDCTTEDANCFKLSGLCSAPYKSRLGENLLQIVGDLENEHDCKAICTQTIGCKVYTYHNTSDPSFPGSCFLLNNLLDPIRTCDTCMTGSYNCYEKLCFFPTEEENGNFTDGLVITNTSNPIKIMPVAASGLCELTIVAVGGGGRYYSNFGGAGSGYIEWTQLNITGTIHLDVTVGNGEVQSSVSKDGEVILVALAGKRSISDVGGDGYSGGGGDVGGDGGTNGGSGGAGGQGAGGKGSGLNVAEIPMNNFVLTPGLGGKSNGNVGGGGGGGLLVDGKGPDGGTEYDGEGYGGGSYSNANHPLPGVVIVSFK